MLEIKSESTNSYKYVDGAVYRISEYDVNDESIKLIVERCPDVKELNLIECDISGVGLGYLSSLKSLESLTLKPGPFCEIKDEDFAKLSGLKSLKLLGLPHINGNLINYFADGLEELSFVDCTLVCLALFKNIHKLTKLKSLTLLSGTSIADDISQDDIIKLAGLNDLESLTLPQQSCSIECLRHIAKIPKLRVLKFDEYIFDIKIENMEISSNLRKELDYREALIVRDYKTLRGIIQAQLCNEILKAYGMKYLSDKIKSYEERFPKLSQFSHEKFFLMSLPKSVHSLGRGCSQCLYNILVKGEKLAVNLPSDKLIPVGKPVKDLVADKEYQEVVTLELQKCPVHYQSIYHKRFIPVGKLHLSIQNTQILDQDLADATKKYPDLEILKLNCCKLTNRGLECISNLKNLKILELNLTDSSICESYFGCFARLKGLKSLVLKGFNSNAGCFIRFLSVIELEVLSLVNCHVTHCKSLFANIAKLSRLKSLSLTTGACPSEIDDSLSLLVDLGYLRVLTLPECPGITAEGLGYIAKIFSLNVLKIGSSEAFIPNRFDEHERQAMFINNVLKEANGPKATI